MTPETRTLIARSSLWVVALTVLIALAGWGASRMEAYVLMDDAGAAASEPNYRLVNPPRYLSYASRQAIGASFKVPDANFGDPTLLASVHERVSQNPWVSRVNLISKEFDAKSQRGIVRIDCEFRRPVAMVLIAPGARTQRTGYFSDDGVLLPSREVPKYQVTTRGPDGQTVQKLYADASHVPAGARPALIHYPAIVGVHHSAPAEGQRWAGRDVTDAIRLIGLLADRPYFAQVDKIDVSDYAQRGDVAIHAGRTTYLFGRFPLDADDLAVIWPDQKLARLDRIVADAGGNLANIQGTINLRIDRVNVRMD